MLGNMIFIFIMGISLSKIVEKILILDKNKDT